MSKLHTHYDNLQVSRSASQEVIRAAYRSLTQKHHPDRHPLQNEEATRKMGLINEAYAVLSDPERRRGHDAWIKEHEGSGAEGGATRPSAQAARDEGGKTPNPPPPRSSFNNSPSVASFNYVVYPKRREAAKRLLCWLGTIIVSPILLVALPSSLTILFVALSNVAFYFAVYWLFRLVVPAPVMQLTERGIRFPRYMGLAVSWNEVVDFRLDTDQHEGKRLAVKLIDLGGAVQRQTSWKRFRLTHMLSDTFKQHSTLYLGNLRTNSMEQLIENLQAVRQRSHAN
ncbi:Chaperone protein DnaJ [compost metagenome]